MKLFLVTAHRWGSSETHNYIHSVRSNYKEAEMDACQHVEDRDGKYDMVIWALEPNKRAKALVTYRGLGYKDRKEGNALTGIEDPMSEEKILLYDIKDAATNYVYPGRTNEAMSILCVQLQKALRAWDEWFNRPKERK